MSEAFLQVLLLAKELQLLRVGTVSVDGTKIDANASKRNSIRYDRAEALREQLRLEIGELLSAREAADTEDLPDPQRLPEELSRREKLKAKLDRASAELERRAKARGARARPVRAQACGAGEAPRPPQGQGDQATTGGAARGGADQHDGRRQHTDAQEPAGG